MDTKKLFEEPLCEIVTFSVEDILTTSAEVPEEDDWGLVDL